MNKKKLTGLLLIVAALVAGFFILNRFSKSDSGDNSLTHTNDSLNNFTGRKDSTNNLLPVNNVPQQKDSIPENWETYSDDKLGISFQHPGSWTKQGKNAEIINLSGENIKTGIYFSDSTNRTRVSIEYSFDSNAVKIYRYAASQFIASQKATLNKSRKLLVDGCEAIEISKEYKINGKGKTLNPPLKKIIVDFMDKNNKGEIQIQFQTPLSKEQEEENDFNKLLSSFKFIKSTRNNKTN